MANKKFSEFTSQTDSANVQFVVGYNGSDNVRISPSNLLSAYLPLAGGTMTGNIIFNDNVSALFGTSSDMTVKHDGSHSKIENNTGHLYIINESDDKDIIFQTDDDAGGVATYMTIDGINQRTDFAKNIGFADDVKALFGDGLDLRIYHDGTDSYVQDTGTGDLKLQGTNLRLKNGDGSSTFLEALSGAAVSIYHNGSKKFQTTSSGIDVTGTLEADNITISGAQGSDGQVLTSTGSGVAWEAASGGATSLNGLTDVLIDGTSSYLVNIPASLSGNPADNTVFGNGAGNALTSGSSNTFIGHDAGAGVSGDEDNVAIGEGAFSASNVFKAVAVGYHAGKNNNGNYNVFIGENAGYNTSSSNNTSVGNNAGRSVTANDHTSIGYQAGYSNTSGSENTNVGHASGYSNTTSSHRTSIGYYANQYITGNQNTAVGSYALRGVSGSSTGQYNTAVGYTAGEDMTTGTTNTLVGWGAGKDITTGSNNSCIGNGSAPSANDATNEITLGNSSITAIRCQVQTISALSDERDKTNIKDSDYGLDLVNSLKPVTFDWNMRDGAKVGEKDLGFIAQDLQEVDDENLQLVYSNNPEKLEASYGRLIPVLVKAIQDLSAKVTELENA